jgi:hypothetical protein
MSFSSAKQTVLTNVEQKEEKASLEREHAALRLKIGEAKKQVTQIVDLSGDVVKQKDILAQVNKAAEDKVKEYQIESKKVADIKNEIEKHSKELSTTKEIYQTLSKKVYDAEAKLEALQKSIKSAEKESDLVATKVLEHKDRLLGAQTEHAEQVGQSTLLATQLQQANEALLALTKEAEVLSQAKFSTIKEHDEALRVLLKVQNEIRDCEIAISNNLDIAQKSVEVAGIKAVEIVATAELEVKKLHQALDDREGAISLRESWNKAKKEKLQEIKLAIEEHLGKEIPVIFPD